jgi:rhodanese-related sulfurtransferase
MIEESAMAPFDLAHTLSTTIYYAVFLLIGVGFGAVLEISGFGDSRRLAAQFYLKDMTVLKVMFTAIIVAATLIVLSSSMEWLDFERVWVNPTYLWPGIVGGIIMGVGFVIGGFCPGTSLVAASTLKIDGIFFAGGVAFGIFVFGESVAEFETFANSSFLGRFTLSDWLGLPTGVVLLMLLVMAFAMFYGAELSERYFGQRIAWRAIRLLPASKLKLAGALSLVSLATIAAFKGQPTPQDRWQWIAAGEEQKLKDRDVYVHPGEVVELMQNAAMVTRILDIRPERDYNLFHLRNAEHTPPEVLTSSEFLRSLKGASDNTVVFVMSNGERDATLAYKTLRSQGVINLYIVEGGVNNWLKVYPIDPCVAKPFPPDRVSFPESLRQIFFRAVGARSYASHPGCACKEYPTDCFLATHADTHKRPTITHDPDIPKIEYTRKVKISKKSKPQGGCG